MRFFMYCYAIALMLGMGGLVGGAVTTKQTTTKTTTVKKKPTAAKTTTAKTVSKTAAKPSASKSTIAAPKKTAGPSVAGAFGIDGMAPKGVTDFKSKNANQKSAAVKGFLQLDTATQFAKAQDFFRQLMVAVKKAWERLKTVFQENEYESRVFKVTQTLESGTEVGFQWDFGFEGAGDPMTPFGIVWAKPFPDSVSVGGMNLALDFEKGPLKMAMSAIGKAGGASADGMENMMSFLRMQPSTVFLFRALHLNMAAIINKGNSTAYPQLKDVPVELLIMLSRLSRTVNIKKTIANHTPPNATEGQKLEAQNPAKWDKKKVVLFTASDVLDKIPEFFRTMIEDEEVEIYARNLQEVADRKNQTGPTAMQKAVSEVCTVVGYEKRCAAITEKLLPVVVKEKPHNTDLELFLGKVRLQRAGLYKGVFKQAMRDIKDPETGESNGKQFRVAWFMRFVEKRMPALQDMLKAVSEQAKSASFDEEQRKLFAAAVDISTLEPERKALEVKLRTLLPPGEDSVVVAKKDPFVKKMTELLKQTEYDAMPDLKSEGVKVKVKFRQALDYWWWLLKQCLNRKFEGDNGYLADDTPLKWNRVLGELVAVATRYVGDERRAEALFKADTNEHEVKVMELDAEGALVDTVDATVVGAQKYQELMGAVLEEKKAVEEAVKAAQKALGKDPNSAEARHALDDERVKAKEFSVHYKRQLRQWKFLVGQYKWKRATGKDAKEETNQEFLKREVIRIALRSRKIQQILADNSLEEYIGFPLTDILPMLQADQEVDDVAEEDELAENQLSQDDIDALLMDDEALASAMAEDQSHAGGSEEFDYSTYDENAEGEEAPIEEEAVEDVGSEGEEPADQSYEEASAEEVPAEEEPAGEVDDVPVDQEAEDAGWSDEPTEVDAGSEEDAGW